MDSSIYFRLHANKSLQVDHVTKLKSNRAWSPEGFMQFFHKILAFADLTASQTNIIPQQWLDEIKLKINTNLIGTDDHENDVIKRFIGIAGQSKGFCEDFYESMTLNQDVMVEDDIEKLNTLIDQMTDGMLKNVVDSDICNVAFVLQTFKDKWLYEMKVAKLTFTQRDMSEKIVEGITGSCWAAIKTAESQQTVIAIPYVSKYVALLILPNALQDPANFAEVLEQNNWNEIIKSKEARQETTIIMPKFKVCTQMNLDAILKDSFGIRNLDGIFHPRERGIIRNMQMTCIEVDEHGTRAANFTAVTLSRGMPIKQVHTIDRPFGFAVAHLPSRRIEFAAQIDYL